MNKPNITYAQNKEDVILRALLKDVKKGFYVDVGANYPVHESVTKLFYEDGWNGINIEPASGLYNLLCADRPRDINLKLGISNREDELVFREYLLGNGLSTFSTETQAAYEKSDFYGYFAKDYIDHKVPVTTLAQLLAEHAPSKRIDFMKIDVEGYEYEAVEGNDWKKFRPVILCIEANHIVKDWHPILEKAHYQKVFWDGLNEYFVAAEHAKQVADFSYADAVFLGPQYISWQEQRKLLALERRQRQTDFELARVSRLATNANQTGPVMPTSFKGFIKFSVWEAARGYEFYIRRPARARPLKITDAKLDGMDTQVAEDALRANLSRQLRYVNPWYRRLTKKLYFALKRRIAPQKFTEGES